jgi:lipid A 4'-phosphatase
VEFFKRHAGWLLPILLMLAITPWTPKLDLSLAHWSFDAEIGGIPSPKYNGFSSNAFFDIMFKYGLIPAQFTCGVAALFFLLTYYKPKYKAYRRPALMLALTMCIGAGAFAHVLFKEFWGRPRPRQIVQFGGKQEFRPYYLPSLKKPIEPSKSFPSGHSTCGFYFFALYFLGKRYKNKPLEYIGLITSITLGILLSYTRLAQGGHFLSDVLFAALLMWESAYFSDWLIYDCAYVSKRLE